LVLCQFIKTFHNAPSLFRKFFLDALPIAGTAGAVEMMTELILSEAVIGRDAEAWIASLGFIKNPDVGMLRNVLVRLECVCSLLFYCWLYCK